MTPVEILSSCSGTQIKLEAYQIKQTIHWHRVFSCQPIHKMQLRSDTSLRLANTFQLSAYDWSIFPPESKLHTGARVNFVLLTYLLTY